MEDTTCDLVLGLGVLDLDLEYRVIDVCAVDAACFWVFGVFG